jgi:transcriptional regulator with XRE-family HTH domain
MSIASMLKAVTTQLRATSDADLCARTGMDAATLCKYRAGTREIGPADLIRLHEATGLTTLEIKHMIAVA